MATNQLVTIFALTVCASLAQAAEPQVKVREENGSVVLESYGSPDTAPAKPQAAGTGSAAAPAAREASPPVGKRPASAREAAANAARTSGEPPVPVGMERPDQTASSARTPVVTYPIRWKVDEKQLVQRMENRAARTQSRNAVSQRAVAAGAQLQEQAQ